MKTHALITVLKALILIIRMLKMSVPRPLQEDAEDTVDQIRECIRGIEQGGLRPWEARP